MFSGVDCLELRFVGVCMLDFVGCFGVCWFVFTLIVLVRLVLLPFM